jgi:hypothetical protein
LLSEWISESIKINRGNNQKLMLFNRGNLGSPREVKWGIYMVLVSHGSFLCCGRAVVNVRVRGSSKTCPPTSLRF